MNENEKLFGLVNIGNKTEDGDAVFIGSESEVRKRMKGFTEHFGGKIVNVKEVVLGQLNHDGYCEYFIDSDGLAIVYHDDKDHLEGKLRYATYNKY